jgi:26S proteasome regulatory subunit N10
MKKNNVAIDVINFGEYAENEQKLSTFVDLVNNADNRYIIYSFYKIRF